MVGALAEPDEGDVWALDGGHRRDVLDVDLACDHLVTQSGNDRRNEREAVFPLVGDQDA